MFKYAKFTPMTDAYTTHGFNEIDDKCKVHRFDVPYVSVEYSNEVDFTELMAAQNHIIEAIEISKIEFDGLVQHSDQVNRMYDVVNAQYTKDLKTISEKYSQEERDTWSSQIAEANAIKDGIATDTPYMTALATDEGITLVQAAGIVLANKNAYDNYSAGALTRKWESLGLLKGEVGL